MATRVKLTYFCCTHKPGTMLDSFTAPIVDNLLIWIYINWKYFIIIHNVTIQYVKTNLFSQNESAHFRLKVWHSQTIKNSYPYVWIGFLYRFETVGLFFIWLKCSLICANFRIFNFFIFIINVKCKILIFNSLIILAVFCYHLGLSMWCKTYSIL